MNYNSTEAKHPRISAIICTANRGDTLLMAVHSILANTHPDFECVVIDQSDNDETKQALLPLQSESRLRYIHTASKGLGKAHNLAIAETQSEIVAITDDDCEVYPDWLRQIETVFSTNTAIGVVYCSVYAAPYDKTNGFIHEYPIEQDQTLTPEKHGRIGVGVGGIGAGMAVRRSCIQDIGGFDSMLGPGALFPSADDTDIAVRALLKGYSVYLASRAHVLHYGYRTWEQGKDLSQRDYTALGAACSKHFRSGAPGMRLAPLGRMRWHAVLTLQDCLRVRRLRGVKRLFYFLSGFLRGLRIPIDRHTLVFHGQATT